MAGEQEVATLSIIESTENRLLSLHKIDRYYTTATRFTKAGAIGFIKDKETTLRNIMVGLAAYVLERLTNSTVFDCPMERHRMYGNCFLYVPVCLLFCANLLIIGEVWKLSGRCFIRRYRRRGDVIARLIPFGFVKAMVGPAAWLIGSFASGDYYLCATVGPGLDKRNLTNPEEIKALEDEFAVGRTRSHTVAWTIFGTVVVLGTLVIVTKNCFLKDDLRLKNLYFFERREAAGAMFAFQKIMRGEDVDQSLVKNKTTLNFGDDDEFDTYSDGPPEKAGREKVKKIFEEAHDDYSQAYDKFRKMYPRVADGSPASSWRAEQLHTQSLLITYGTCPTTIAKG